MEEKNVYKYKKYIALSILVAVFGEIYFYPFDSKLRFSAGVMILEIIILVEDDVNEILLSILCGIAVFSMRGISDILFFSRGFRDIILINVPSFYYYIIFGVFIKAFDIRKNKDNIVRVLITISIVDSLSNMCEAITRNNISLNIASGIIIAALVRAFTSYLFYFIYNNQKLFILKKEHQKRYTQLNLLVSNIQAEMFYLKKSEKNIEDVMSKSYNLYETHKDDEVLRDKTLDIAREIHEIKKDYFRVLKGFEAFIDSFDKDSIMNISSIFTIIKDNTNRYVCENNKHIGITFKFQEDILLSSYYNLFTILNNLIINSIDACKNNDEIKIIEESDEDFIYFKVSDTGEGIEKDIIPYIFNPGFTTKFDNITGKSSTGIGLCHVKNILDDLHGTINIESEVNKGTIFRLKIPKTSLIGE